MFPNKEMDNLEKYISEKLGKEEWVEINYRFNKESDYTTSFFIITCLAKNNYLETVRKSTNWDIRIGNSLNGYFGKYVDGKYIESYYTYHEESIHPLFIELNFPSLGRNQIDPIEEFVTFFHLYKNDNIYYDIDEAGDLIEVIKREGDNIFYKIKYLKIFAGVKDCSIVINYECSHYFNSELEKEGLQKNESKIHTEEIIYNKYFDETSTGKSFGRIIGKKIIYGKKEEENYFDKKNKYEEFIIGLNEDGEEIYFSCNSDILANNFGGNPENPDYLTPVSFKKEVLKKYYDLSSRYEVRDGYLDAIGLWGLRMDNNHPNFIVVFLGDLSSLPLKEQKHWKLYNVKGDNKISYTSWERNFQCNFTDSERPDLFFKQKYLDFNEKWEKEYGFKFFLPLKEDDSHYFKSLHIPITNENKEFDEQILSLTKILIDSINERDLKKSLKNSDEITGSINILDKFIEENRSKNSNLISFLKDLQSLRSSGVAHRKGTKYEEVKEKIGLTNENLIPSFEEILIKSVEMINTLEQSFLIKK